MDLQWMAWTLPTALFFSGIAALLAGMCIWEFFQPGGAPRQGLLGMTTTRGDRLFMSLLGSAFIALGWIGWVPLPPQWSLLCCMLYSLFVFRWL